MEALSSLREILKQKEKLREDRESKIKEAQSFIEQLKEEVRRAGIYVVTITFRDKTRLFINLHRNYIEIDGRVVIMEKDYERILRLKKQEVIEVK